jgi:penicillin-binding protein 1C
VRTFGIDSPLRTRGFAAVKTGTSKDLRDNWCVGYTDRYTVGCGSATPAAQPMHDVSGVSGAAPVWQALVRHLHQGQPSVAPAPPAGIVTAAVRWAGDHEAPRREAFLAGTAPRDGGVTALRARGDPMGITSPTDGSLFALDPDIPPQAQRITFAGERGTWAVDGRVVGHGEQLHWPPWPGRHRLELRAADGRVLQAVRFEVRGLRGAAARPAPRPAARPAAVAAAASAR